MRATVGNIKILRQSPTLLVKVTVCLNSTVVPFNTIGLSSTDNFSMEFEVKGSGKIETSEPVSTLNGTE